MSYSNWLEMTAAFMALMYAMRWASVHIILRTDSEVIRGWFRGSGSADPWAMRLVEILRRCAERQDDALSVAYIAGKSKIRADDASRDRLTALGPRPYAADEIPPFPDPLEAPGLGAAQWVAEDVAAAREAEPLSEW